MITRKMEMCGVVATLRSWIVVSALIIGDVTAAVTCPPGAPPATCNETFGCNFHCVGTSSYTMYKEPDSVSENEPDKPFPTSYSENEAYVEDAVTPAAVIIAFAAVAFLCCCFYNICNCRRIDQDSGLISCHPAQCWGNRGGLCRKLAWLVLAGLSILYLGLLSASLASNKDTADGIRGLPDFINGTAHYLEDPIISSLRCAENYPNAVYKGADEMQNSPTITQCASSQQVTCDSVNASLTEIKAEALKIRDQVGGTGNSSLISILSDGVKDLINAGEDADDWADGAATIFESSTTAILAIVLVFGLIALLLSVCVASRDSCNTHKCTACNLNIVVLLFFLLAFLAAVWILVLRLSAGYCADPFTITANSLKASNNTAGPFYTMCHTYSNTKQNETWPWRTEQQTVADLQSNITSRMPTLKTNWTSIGGDTSLSTELDENVTKLGCVFGGDDGVLGYTGLLKCGTLNAYVHQMVIGYCEDVFDPLNTLAACMLVLAISILFCNWLEVALRREPAGSTKVVPENIPMEKI